VRAAGTNRFKHAGIAADGYEMGGNLQLTAIDAEGRRRLHNLDWETRTTLNPAAGVV